MKERADGDFIYSFSAEKQKRLITQRTLHAVVNDDENIANNQSSDDSIPNSTEDVNDSTKIPSNLPSTGWTLTPITSVQTHLENIAEMILDEPYVYTVG